MLDADIVAASPATVYRVLKTAGCFARWNRQESLKGRGFQQPLAPHEHWHVNISYVNICGTFYYLTSMDCIRPHVPLSLDDARRLVESFVEHYNHVRLHSAIGYVTPADKLAGREAEIFAERDRKLEAARERRRQARQLAATDSDRLQHQMTWAEDRATQRCDLSAGPGVGVKRCARPPIGASPIPSLQHQCANPDWHDASLTTSTTPFNSLTTEGQNPTSR
jgi:hypothetical protein